MSTANLAAGADGQVLDLAPHTNVYVRNCDGEALKLAVLYDTGYRGALGLPL